MPSEIKKEKRKSAKEGRRKSERNGAAVITYAKRSCTMKSFKRIIEDIKQVFQTKPQQETFRFLCMPELWTVFSLYFASKTEGREVHDLQSAFWKLNQLF